MLLAEKYYIALSYYLRFMVFIKVSIQFYYCASMFSKTRLNVEDPFQINDRDVFLQAVADIILSKHFSTKGVKPVCMQYDYWKLQVSW